MREKTGNRLKVMAFHECKVNLQKSKSSALILFIASTHFQCKQIATRLLFLHTSIHLCQQSYFKAIHKPIDDQTKISRSMVNNAWQQTSKTIVEIDAFKTSWNGNRTNMSVTTNWTLSWTHLKERLQSCAYWAAVVQLITNYIPG